MPPLRHKVGDVFDIEKSEVVAWVMKQPGFKEWAFSRLKNSGRFAYDAATGTWRGVPYKEVMEKVEWRNPDALRNSIGGRPIKFTNEAIGAMVAEHPGLSANKLAKATGNTYSTLADSLERARLAGLVEKREAGWYPVAPKIAVEDVD